MRLTGLRGWYTMVWVIHAGALDVTWGELTGAVERMIFEADRKYGRPRARSAD